MALTQAYEIQRMDPSIPWLLDIDSTIYESLSIVGVVVEYPVLDGTWVEPVKYPNIKGIL